MKKGILSTIIISITSSINLLTFLFILLPFDTQELIENNQAEENMEFIMVALLGSIVGFAILLIYAWMLAIALIHGICLIFTIKNRKSDTGWIRIYNYVLDAVNVFLILGPIIKILINLNWDMILKL
jgi:hypothetical protein